jgi:4a-hydroxytetrahydrobiopterin dehydratase
MTTIDELRHERCVPRKGSEHLTPRTQIDELLALLPGWSLAEDGKSIVKDYAFKNFYRTMAFVNAIAWIANDQDHHPDMEVGYGHCKVRYNTHDVGGLSRNDFICAARVEGL